MKKSRVDTAETRLRIISTASRLFLEKGLAETAISDVMVASGLTQGGFYRHFESKDHLVAEANRAANEAQFRFYDQAIEGLDFRASIQTIVRLYLSQAREGGEVALCPLANLGSELRHANDHIRNVAMEGYERLVGAITAMAGGLGIANHAAVGGMIVSTIVGAVTLSRLAVDAEVAESILQNAQITVETLLDDPSGRPG